jgi:hypothetical protein
MAVRAYTMSEWDDFETPVDVNISMSGWYDHTTRHADPVRQMLDRAVDRIFAPNAFPVS